MKQVKFNGSRWTLSTKDSLFNPNTEVYFAISEYFGESKLRELVTKLIGKQPEVGIIYDVPDECVYTSAHGPKCGPWWPDPNCHECGGKGVLACVKEPKEFVIGNTDDYDKEAELIMQGKSNIHPELNR